MYRHLLAWKIAVYGQEHGRPHFHIEGPDFRCSVSLDTFEVIIGSVPKRVLTAANAWAKANADLLRKKWKELNS